MSNLGRLKLAYRLLYPAQQQAVKNHMDENFNPLHPKAQSDDASEEYFSELLMAALEAELPRKKMDIIKREILEVP